MSFPLQEKSLCCSVSLDSDLRFKSYGNLNCGYNFFGYNFFLFFFYLFYQRVSFSPKKERRKIKRGFEEEVLGIWLTGPSSCH